MWLATINRSLFKNGQYYGKNRFLNVRVTSDENAVPSGSAGVSFRQGMFARKSPALIRPWLPAAKLIDRLMSEAVGATARVRAAGVH
ncbi:hypothetical protein RI103_29540 [Paraburkholderia sp. FT54]|uniref:hypothetical protein n=1 Tax=Paraburkholderia sp. FT54 TaxID=3074437 RepID=UPI0028772929|nr:hypothetical protein [Paraburkholderia sp. FT54]WNC92411.1 hypothetical protein RI103_29540 [Paraburkholderia sp. FT54]